MTTKFFDGGLHQQTVGSVVFGIDQSLTGFGLTVLDVDTEKYVSYVVKSRQVGARRLQDINNFLAEMMRLYVLENGYHLLDAAMEGYAFKSQMAHKAGEVGGLVKLVLAEHGLFPIQVSPPSVKKYATGKGKDVPKSLVMKEVHTRWGAHFTDDNAADSYVIARIAARKVENQYQQELVSKLFGNEHQYRETRPGK